jgi:hypothetical protein
LRSPEPWLSFVSLGDYAARPMKTKPAILALAVTLALIVTINIQAQTASAPAGNAVPVTPDNFNRAETDMIFADGVKTQGLGKFLHHREPMSIRWH